MTADCELLPRHLLLLLHHGAPKGAAKPSTAAACCRLPEVAAIDPNRPASPTAAVPESGAASAWVRISPCMESALVWVLA